MCDILSAAGERAYDSRQRAARIKRNLKCRAVRTAMSRVFRSAVACGGESLKEEREEREGAWGLSTTHRRIQRAKVQKSNFGPRKKA